MQWERVETPAVTEAAAPGTETYVTEGLSVMRTFRKDATTGETDGVLISVGADRLISDDEFGEVLDTFAPRQPATVKVIKGQNRVYLAFDFMPVH